MSTKFNKFGQWSLGSDGDGTTLIKGIKPVGQELSTGKEPDSGLKGADITKAAILQAQSGKLPELNKAPLQPTNERMFGHLVPTEEQIEKADKEWNNTINKPYEEFKKPIDHLNKSEVNKSWGLGKSFNSMLSEEEVAARNKCITE